MSIILPPVVTSWETPGWASEARDGDPIEYRLDLGLVAGVRVAVVQQDDVRTGNGVASVTRHPAHVLLGGERLTPIQACEVVALVQRAVAVMEGRSTA